MKPAQFDYLAPKTLNEAVALLERFDKEGEDAKIPCSRTRQTKDWSKA